MLFWEAFWGSETILSDSTMVGTSPYTFVQTYRMNNTKSDPDVNYELGVKMLCPCRFIIDGCWQWERPWVCRDGKHMGNLCFFPLILLWTWKKNNDLKKKLSLDRERWTLRLVTRWWSLLLSEMCSVITGKQWLKEQWFCKNSSFPVWQRNNFMFSKPRGFQSTNCKEVT